MKLRLVVLVIVQIWIVSLAPSYAQSQKGRVSFYSEGKLTSSGERFNKNAMTCAHPRVRFGTIVKVEYRGKAVSCRVNDRGPFVRGRVLDLSLGAARALGMTGAGVVYAQISWD